MQSRLQMTSNGAYLLNWSDFRDDYLWAATVLSSRSFPSSLVDSNSAVTPCNVASSTDNIIQTEETNVSPPLNSSVDSDDPILVPIMDMLNHRPNRPVTWLKSSNTITFIAETAYEANTEIFNNYGPKGNEECKSVSSFTY